MGMGSGSRKSDIGKAGDLKQTVNRPSARAALSYIPDDRKEAPMQAPRLPTPGSARGCQ